MWEIFKKRKDILGMNARNLLYTRPYNLNQSRRIADHKLLTKEILKKAGLPVPATYKIIRKRGELSQFNLEDLPKSFVIKPNKGLGGEGIMVIYGRNKSGNWITSNNQEISKEKIRLHINDILDGHYSLSHTPDIAFMEERVKLPPEFKLYCYKGVFDIRLIIFNKVPIMAMLRLPTKSSRGRANLCSGGVGVGIDIRSGITTHAVIKNKFLGDSYIEYLPGTRFLLRGINIPFWDKILKIAVEVSQIVNLGYAGVDITLDKELGPVIFEVNARPGLSIQNANRASLGDRLRRVAGLKIKTIERGIAIGKDLFGGEVEQELTEISGKKMLGVIEEVKVISLEGKEVQVKAKVDTGAAVSSISKDFACQLGFADAIAYAEKYGVFEVYDRDVVDKFSKEQLGKALVQHEKIKKVQKIHSSHGSSYRIKIDLDFELAGVRLHNRVTVMDRSNLQYEMIIGRQDLKRFLVDPSK